MSPTDSGSWLPAGGALSGSSRLTGIVRAVSHAGVSDVGARAPGQQQHSANGAAPAAGKRQRCCRGGSVYSSGAPTLLYPRGGRRVPRVQAILTLRRRFAGLRNPLEHFVVHLLLESETGYMPTSPSDGGRGSNFYPKT